jgi:hypothetical protein
VAECGYGAREKTNVFGPKDAEAGPITFVVRSVF